MKRELIILLTEAFIKDIERYELDKIGFINDPRRETGLLLRCVPHPTISFKDAASYRKWCTGILQTYYLKKNFSDFVRNSLQNPLFRKMVYKLMSGILKKRYRYERPTETDSYLAPPGKTLSYLLCNEDFIVLFTKHFTCGYSFSSPGILHQYCNHLLAQLFPLSEKQILQALVEDKPVYWETVCHRLKILTESVTKTAIKTYKNDTIHDIWTETCLELKEALKSGRIPLSAKAQNVLAYAAGIIKNKIKASFRKQKKDPYLLIENWEQELSLKNSPEFSYEFKEIFNMQDFFDLGDINFEDEYEVRKALSYALYYQDNPIHKQLTEGLEDKIEILIAHYVRKQSYDEIALEKFGRLPQEQHKREVDKLRQDVSRVKIKLKERFKKIMDTNQ
ncbi:MAG: hypothetical protein ACLTSL_01205 [Odoribacter splanchnicus]